MPRGWRVARGTLAIAMAGSSGTDTVTVRLKRDLTIWLSTALMASLPAGLFLAGAVVSLGRALRGEQDLFGAAMAFVLMAAGPLWMVWTSLRVCLTRPQIQFGRRRIVVHDRGLLKAPLSIRTRKLNSVCFGPFNRRADAPPWSGRRGRDRLRTFLRTAGSYFGSNPGPLVRRWAAVPDLSTSVVAEASDFLVVFHGSVPAGRVPRRGLGFVNWLSKGYAGYDGPLADSHMRALLGRVEDAPEADRLARLVPVVDIPAPEICDWLRAEAPSLAEVWAWLRRRPPTPPG